MITVFVNNVNGDCYTWQYERPFDAIGVIRMAIDEIFQRVENIAIFNDEPMLFDDNNNIRVVEIPYYKEFDELYFAVLNNRKTTIILEDGLGD